MQSKWPTKRIFIGKTDLDESYCRIHANATTTSTFILIVDELAFLYLRLPFGTKYVPSEYTTVSEAETNYPEYRITQDDREDFS